MAIRSLINGGSVLRRWISSYLLVLLVPFLISFMVVNLARSAILTEVTAANRASLESGLRNVDAAAESMRTALISLANDAAFARQLGCDAGGSDFTNALPDTVKAIASRTFVGAGFRLVIYVPDADTVITRTTANPSVSLHAAMRYQGSIDIDSEEYRARLNIARPKYDWRILSGIAYPDGRTEYMTLSFRFQPHGYVAAARLAANVFAMTPLEDFLSPLPMQEGYGLLIYDAAGELAYAVGCETPPDVAMEAASEQQARIVVGGTAYRAASAASGVFGWTFALLIPEAQMYARVNAFWRVALLCFVGVLVLGLFAILLLVERNYRPVRKTLRSFGIEGGERGQDEFELMRHSWAEMDFRNRDMRQRLDTQRGALRKNHLFALLHGNRPLLAEEDVREGLHLDLDGKQFGILIFSVEQGALETAAREIQGFCEGRERFFFGSCLYLEDQMITCLLAMGEERARAFEAEAPAEAEAMLRALKEHAGLAACAVLSEACEAEGLREAYRGALEAVQYQFVTRKGGVLRPGQLKEAQAAIPPAETELLAILCEAVAARRLSDAESVLDALFARASETGARDAEIERFHAYFWAWMVGERAVCADPTCREQVRRALFALRGAEDENALRAAFRDMLCSLVGERASAPTLSARVTQYVAAHYRDPNLCLSMIAEAMDLSPKYLSQLFRSETGGGLLDYVNLVRVRAAKALLQGGAHTVAEASELVGYGNVKTFRRAFLKLEGVNPSQAAGNGTQNDEGGI